MKSEINKYLSDQELISSKKLLHFLKHQNKYLLLLLIFVLGAPLLLNQIQGKPLIMGGESYHHLSLARELSWNNFYYFPLKVIVSFVPESLLFIIPLFLAIGSLLIFLKLTKRFKFSKKSTFFFLALLIISPSFVFTFITISAYSAYLFLVLLGFLLLTQEKETVRSFSLVPFLLATFFDIFSSVFLLLLLMGYFYSRKEKEKTLFKSTTASIITLTVFNGIILKIPFFLGPFHLQQRIPDLISDLGGISGINFFTFLLAFIGLAITWKKKNFYFAYILLPFTIIAYIYNTQAVFHLSLTAVFFATTGFIRLFERKWNLATLKRFTFFLLILGLLFSTLTYLERISDNGPSKSDIQALTWVHNNVPNKEVVFSSPENSPFISYFSRQEPFYQLHHENERLMKNLTQKALSSLYIHELFPILEQNNVSIIYINRGMKEQLSKEQGFLFLLKNERFKIIYSHEDSEVWMFAANQGLS